MPLDARAPIRILLALFALAGILAAQEPIKVEVEGARRSAAELESQVKPRIEALRARVPENPNEAQATLASEIESTLAKLGALRDLMIRLDEAERRRRDHEEAAAQARDRLDGARRALDKPEVPGTIDDVVLRDINAAAQAAAQAVTTAENEVARVTRERGERARTFAETANNIEKLGKERAGLLVALDQSENGPERKDELALLLLRNELEMRRTELQRDRHTDIDRLDESSAQRAQAQLELVRLEKQAADARLSLARERHAAALEAARKKAEEEALRKKQEAEAENQSEARKALLGLQALALDLEARKNEEERIRTEWEEEKDSLTKELKRIESQEKELDTLFPEGEKLDAVRGLHLDFQLGLVREELPRLQRRLGRLTERVARLQRGIDTERFQNQQLHGLLQSLEDRGLRGPVSADAEANDRSEDYYRLRVGWNRGVKQIEDATAGTTNPVMLALRQRLEFWRTEWATAEKKIRDNLDAREAILNVTADAARESLQRNERIADILVDREARLEALAFWLRRDPPFSAPRREGMAKELAALGSSLGARLGDLGADLGRGFGHLPGKAGFLALICGLILAVVRRLRSNPAARIERIVAKGRDPLVELALVTGFLVVETSHLLLFMIGLASIWLAPVPTDPFAGAACALVLIGTLRLALVRLVAYISEASEDVDTFLALEAQHFIRQAVIGFVVTIPPLFFFERADAPYLGEAARFAATLWAFVVAGRLTFRRRILAVLVPAREGNAIGRGLRGLIRGTWPLIALFIGLIAVLEFLGYQNASLFLLRRTLVASAYLVALNVVYQFIHAFIQSRTISQVEHAENTEQTQELMTRAHQRQLEAYHRMFNLPLLAMTLIGGVIGVMAIFGLWGARWSKFSSSQVFKEVVEDGKVLPGLTWGDLGVALLIFVIGYVVARIIRDLIVVGIGTTHDDRRGGRYAVGTLVFYLLMMLVIVFGLRTMQVKLTDFNWLLATAGVAIGFGLTQILSNFVSGLILFVERPVQVGDIITIGDVEGDVRKISIRSTIVRTRDGVSIILPNRKLIEEDVINWSHSDAKTRIKVEVGVAYGSDVALVKKVLIEVAEREGRVLKRPRPEVDFMAFGESELSFRILVWLATPDLTLQRRVRSDLNSAIDATFRRNGIEIPFPQRDLHIRDTPRTIEQKRAEAEQERQEKLEGGDGT
ncbi:MAG: mechanosensitive ion channel [Planctomycetes bacterium]|nr:mechanosensitive ion channel [Planctomycetota bacterium]